MPNDTTAEWLTTKWIRAGDEVSINRRNEQPEGFRTVAKIEIWGSWKHIYFTDGSRFDCAAATKLWVRKP